MKYINLRSLATSVITLLIAASGANALMPLTQGGETECQDELLEHPVPGGCMNYQGCTNGPPVVECCTHEHLKYSYFTPNNTGADTGKKRHFPPAKEYPPMASFACHREDPSTDDWDCEKDPGVTQCDDDSHRYDTWSLDTCE